MQELHKEFKEYFTGLTRNYGFCNINNGYKDLETGKIKFKMVIMVGPVNKLQI
jgi:hypothetical protein